MGLRRKELMLSSVVKRFMFAPAGPGSSGGPATSPPSTPTGLVATGGTGSIIWDWDDVPGATSYDLLYSSDGGSNYSTLATGVATNTYTDSSAASHCNASGISFVKVRANNAGGSSAYSSGVAGTEYITAWGIVDWWNLEDVNPAIGSDTLTNNNSVTFTSGKLGNAATFVSSGNQYLSKTSNSGLQTGNVDWFFGAWFKIPDNASHYCIGQKADTGQYEWLAMVLQTSGVPRFYVYNQVGGASNIVDWGSAVSTGAWHFLFVWLDSVNSKINISIDGGAPVQATRNVTLTAGTGAFRLGSFVSLAYVMNGQIDSTVFGKPPTSIGNGAGSLAYSIRDKFYNSGNGRSAPFNG